MIGTRKVKGARQKQLQATDARLKAAATKSEAKSTGCDPDLTRRGGAGVGGWRRRRLL